MALWKKLLGSRNASHGTHVSSDEEKSSVMSLVEMTDVPPMAGGAPIPFVLADEHSVSLIYYLQTHDPERDGTTIRMVDAASEGEPVAVIRFDRVLWHRLGPPNEEAIGAHPLCHLGLYPYTAKEVIGSQAIRDFCHANRIHQYHTDDMFDGYRHFAIAFHDSVFEAIAYNYSVKELGQNSILSVAASELGEWRS